MTTRQFLWQLLRYRATLFWLCVLCYILLYCGFIVPGWIVREVFNTLTGDAPVRFSFATLMGLLILIILLQIATFHAIILLETTFAHAVYALLRGNLLEQILRQPGARALPHSPGEAVSRFRDDVQSTQWFWSMSYNLLANGAFALVAFVLMIAISPLLTLTLFGPLVVVVWLLQRLRTRIEGLRKARQERVGEVTGLLGEIFGAVQAIKVAGAEERILAHFDQRNQARGEAAMKDYLFNRLLELFFYNISDLGAAALLLLAAQTMRAGTFTVGDFVLFVSFLPWITGTVGTMGRFMAAYQQVGVSLQRLRLLLQGAPDQTLVRHRPVYLRGPLPELPPVARTVQPLQTLSVHGLTYHFPGTGQGICDIDFQLERGSLTVITGRVGSGKTTLLRTLLGLLPSDGGEIRWNGELVADPATFFIPPHSAYTPQTSRLFSESLRDNILMGLTEAQVEVADTLQRALDRAVLTPDLATMPDGLATCVGPRGVRLSGGQAQRTAAARMFMRGGPQGTDLLVFDDLSSALNVATEQLLWQQLFAEEMRPTCLVVSHRHAVLARADQILLLADGRLVDRGTLAELLERNGEIQQWLLSIC